MVLRLCWVCWLYLGSVVLDTQVCACMCTGAQRWSKWGGQNSNTHSVAWPLELWLWRHQSGWTRVYRWCRLFLLSILSRLRETGREDGADLLLQKHHYAPVSHLSKQAGLMTSRPARKDGRSTLIKWATQSNQKSEEYRTQNVQAIWITLHIT